MERIKSSNIHDFFNKVRLKNDLTAIQRFDTAKDIALRNPKTYSIEYHSSGARIIRNTNDCIRTAEYNKNIGWRLSNITHERICDGKISAINTAGDYIENFDLFKRKYKIIKFANFKDMLSYFRKKQMSKNFNIIDILKRFCKIF